MLQQVLNQLELHEFGQRDIFDVHMALEEALVNAIKHGNKLDPNKRVRVTCQVSHERVRLQIEDQGEGFDPEEVPDPTAEENLDKPSGRGIMLMRSFMSSVAYSERGNCVTMTKTRTITTE